MVVNQEELQQITAQRRTVRRWSGDDRGGAGIELSCLSTISRSVSVMHRNKSAQPPVSVCGQVLEKKRTVSPLLEAENLITYLSMTCSH